jgi:hypothetical protein
MKIFIKPMLATFILFLTILSCNHDEIEHQLVKNSVIEEVVEETIVEETPIPEPELEPEPVPEPEPIPEEESFPLKAFYSAYGGGSNVTGGRGGEVYHVTNLQNSGTGSFRDAVSESNRIIVFDVSGTINLTNSLDIYSSNVTIAGQSAPIGGITLTGQRVTQSGCDNFIIRYLRVRPNYSSNDAWSFINCNNVIIDHCSTSWGGDEILSFRGEANNITIQRTLIGDGKTGSIFGDSDDASIGSNLSFLNNAYYNITHRHPNLNINSRADMINNIVFNWKYRLSRISGDIQLNHVNNYYAMGCLNSINGTGMMVLAEAPGTPEIYTAGNYIDNGVLTDPNADNWMMFEKFNSGAGGSISSSFQSNNEFTQIGAAMPIKSALNAFNDVTTDCGANKVLNASGNSIKSQDPIDKIFLDNIIKGNCVSYTSASSGQNYNTFPYYIAFHNAVSNTPINSHPTNYDSDKDGMPDVWEVAKGFNPNFNDSAQDADNDGYTNLEEFLNLISL